MKAKRREWAGLLFLSGCSALIYEVLWMRRLGDILGNSILATQLVLAVFFAGMALGAYGVTRSSKRASSFINYMRLEAVLALFGACSPWLLDILSSPQFLFWIEPQTTPLQWFGKAALATLFLLPPTLCMGASLPLLVECISTQDETTASTASWVYFWNTLGAACGAWIGGLLLPRYLGVTWSIEVAALLNVCIVCWLYVRLRDPVSSERESLRKAEPTTSGYIASFPVAGLLLFGLSGMCAVAYEVLWTRALMSILGNSIYSFSALLTVYLLGLACGGGLWRSMRRWKLSWGGLQLFLSASGCISVWILKKLPIWEESLRRTVQPTQWSGFWLEWLWISALFFLPCLCIGMLFPAMIDCVETWSRKTSSTQHSGYADRLQYVGIPTSVTTFGGVIAPLLIGLWAMPRWGVGSVLIGIAILQAMLATLFFVYSARWSWSWFGVVAIGVLSFFLPQKLQIGHIEKGERVLFFQEGWAASLSVVANTKGMRKLKLNGRFSMGSAQGVFGEKRQGHIPRLLHPAARRILVLGVGTGHSLAAISAHPSTQIDAVEIVPGVLRLLPFFRKTNHSIWKHPKVRMFSEDARHFMTAIRRPSYDLIVSDLFHSYKAGVGGLYSLEQYERGRRALRKKGMYVQWIPLYQMSKEGLRVLLRTFTHVFPRTYGLLAYLNVQTPVLGLVGMERDTQLNMNIPKTSRSLSKQLKTFGLSRVLDLQALVILQHSQLVELGRGAPLNTEDFPWFELNMPFAKWSPQWASQGQRHIRSLLRIPWNTPMRVSPTRSVHTQWVQRQQAIRWYLKARLAHIQHEQTKEYALLTRAMKSDLSWMLPRNMLSNRVSSMIQKKQWKRADGVLGFILKNVPQYAEGWALRGSIAHLTKRTHQAIPFFLRAVRLNPELRMAFRNAMLLLLRSGQTQKAAQLALQSSLGRKDKALLQRIGTLLMQKEHWSALKPVADAISNLPKPPKDVWALTGYVRWKLGEYTAAILHLKRAVERAPHRLQIWGWLFRAQVQIGALNQALQTVRQALQIFPGHPSLLAHQKRIQEAVRLPEWTAPTTRTATSAPTARPIHRSVHRSKK